jgi:uncharacterized protein (TIGR02246 family)
VRFPLKFQHRFRSGAPGPRDFSCKDCSGEDSGYIVHDGLWASAGLHLRDFCCQSCLSKRLGRPLTNADCTICPLNLMCVPRFDTEEDYRLLYSQSGMNYDEEKGAYLERCARLGLKPNWSMANEEPAIRTLMSRWIEAYQDRDAKRLAALEAPDVQIVDRFGELHRPSGRKENEKLWSDAFDIVLRDTAPPKVTIDHIRFLRPDVAVVLASWQLAEEISLVDGGRIPPFSQADISVVIKSQNVWLVAAHNI